MFVPIEFECRQQRYVNSVLDFVCVYLVAPMFLLLFSKAYMHVTALLQMMSPRALLLPDCLVARQLDVMPATSDDLTIVKAMPKERV